MAPSFQQNALDFVSTTQDLENFCGYKAGRNNNVIRHINLKHITGGAIMKCNNREYSTKLKADMKKKNIIKRIINFLKIWLIVLYVDSFQDC